MPEATLDACLRLMSLDCLRMLPPSEAAEDRGTSSGSLSTTVLAILPCVSSAHASELGTRHLSYDGLERSLRL